MVFQQLTRHVIHVLRARIQNQDPHVYSVYSDQYYVQVCLFVCTYNLHCIQKYVKLHEYGRDRENVNHEGKLLSMKKSHTFYFIAESFKNNR